MKKQNFKQKNEEEIKAYIAKHQLEAQRTESGLYYQIFKQGNGLYPNPDSNITIAYMGYLTNGNTFDQNPKLEINLTEVIPGWTEGIQYFKTGSEGILLIPSHLAYGKTDYGNIPGGSVLIFDIQLIAVE